VWATRKRVVLGRAQSVSKEQGGSFVEEGAADFIVEATGVQKVYVTGGLRVRALRGVDLGVRRGEMVAIMGPSGSGKTTLLNVLSGLDDLSDGEVYVDGEYIKGMSDRRRTRFRAEKMGFIFQSYNLIPVLSAVENIELPLLVAGKKPKKARQWAQDAIEMVGLADQAKKRPAEMSGGQQQRITVARSLVNNPAIVWADEPTGALDSETSKGIMDLLVRMNEQEQQTFVLVTHDAAVAARAHRTIRMRDGRIASDESNGKGA
jgi:ABC-type lipoprotein export system ATPase subunit